MKAILVFDLEDPEDQRLHKLHTHAVDLSIAFHEITRGILHLEKHHEPKYDDFFSGVEAVSKIIGEALEGLPEEIFE